LISSLDLFEFDLDHFPHPHIHHLTPLSPSKLHEVKPQNKPNHFDWLLAVGEPLLKASQHEFKAFKEWILSM